MIKKTGSKKKNQAALVSVAMLMSAAALSGCSIGANAQSGAALKAQTVAEAESEVPEQVQSAENSEQTEKASEQSEATEQLMKADSQSGIAEQAKETVGQSESDSTEESAELTAMTAGAAAADSSAVYEKRDETVYIQTDNVNVRTSPEVNNGVDGNGGNLAFVARKGQSFQRKAYSDGFSEIEKDGQSYYVSSAYLAVTPPAEESGVVAGIAAENGAQGTGNPAQAEQRQAADSAGGEGKSGGTAANGSSGAAASAQTSSAAYENGQEIGLDSAWKYADFAEIKSGKAVFYKAASNRKGKTIAVNAGHGTKGGTSVKTFCHPDKTPKVTGGTTSAGATKAVAVSGGMTFHDGTPEKTVTLRMAQILKEKLLAAGYDVLMLRDCEDVQLDNVARSVIANNTADCHIALHWDSDGLSSIKGCFYMSVPDKLKSMEPVASHWQEHERMGDNLIAGLKTQGMKIWGSNPLDMDLTQTSFSTIPSVDIELGNQASRHDDEILRQQADGLVAGVNGFFGF